MLCYATYPIRAQLSKKLAERREKAEKGESLDKMDYGLLPIYVISLLNFSIGHESEAALENGLVSRYAIRSDHNGELMTSALQFVYLELGRLTIRKDEPQKCRTLLEKFAFSLKYMHELPERPLNFEENVLKLLYDAAEFANMPVERQTDYETVMRTELDIIAEKNYARETGLAEGRAEGLAEGRAEGRAEGEAAKAKSIAKGLLDEGISIEVIRRVTGLSAEEVKAL
jgi:predicted transposase/invertase (TIGR01784 family)